MMPATARLMARHYVDTVVRTKRSVIVGIVLGLVGLLFVAAGILAPGPKEQLGLYYLFLFSGPAGVVLQFTALFFGAAVAADEVDNGTAIYLLSRPLSRPMTFLGRLAAAWVVLAVLMSALNLLVGLFTGGPGHLHRILLAEIPIVLGCGVYVALFALLATFVRNALAVGAVVSLLWDFPLSSVPLDLHLLTLRYPLVSLVRGVAMDFEDPEYQALWSSGMYRVFDQSPWTSFVVLILVLVVIAGVAARLAAVRPPNLRQT